MEPNPKGIRRHGLRAASRFPVQAILAVASVTLLGMAFLQSRKSPGAPPLNTGSETPPGVEFKDITSLAGVSFSHFNGAEGEKLLPETMGGGVAILDFDSDGDQDLIFVNGTDWPWSTLKKGPASSLSIYLNRGNGSFEEMDLKGLSLNFYGMGLASGDYDSDGFPDLYITGVGGNKLLKNLGGSGLRDVTAETGTSAGTDFWSTGAAWLDLDNDGDLDLFVCNYIGWSRKLDHEVDYQLAGVGRSYGPPVNYPGSHPLLYRNDGGGRFTEVSEQAGFRIKNPATGGFLAKSLAIAPVDINRDGWIDIVVANDTVQNFVFLNQKNGTFTEVGARYGIAYDSYGQTRGAMGIDIARFKNDDALGIAIGNFANEMNSLYVSQQDTTIFADEALAEGIGSASKELLKFGLFFFDYDLDGRLDLLTANGHLEPGVELLAGGQKYRQPAQLYWNRGGAKGGRFIPVTPKESGNDLFKPIVGRGSAFGDLDGDGDLDVVITQIGGKPMLLRNDQKTENSWIRIKVRGKKSNLEGIGTWVTLKTNQRVQARQVMPTRSYLSQSELPVTFGLLPGETGEQLEIVWPGNRRQKVLTFPRNQYMVIEEQPGKKEE